MIGCTGGWCTRRLACDAYTAGKASEDVRLCQRGREQPRTYVTALEATARLGMLELARSLQTRGALPQYRQEAA